MFCVPIWTNVCYKCIFFLPPNYHLHQNVWTAYIITILLKMQYICNKVCLGSSLGKQCHLYTFCVHIEIYLSRFDHLRSSYSFTNGSSVTIKTINWCLLEQLLPEMLSPSSHYNGNNVHLNVTATTETQFDTFTARI